MPGQNHGQKQKNGIVQEFHESVSKSLFSQSMRPELLFSRTKARGKEARGRDRVWDSFCSTGDWKNAFVFFGFGCSGKRLSPLSSEESQFFRRRRRNPPHLSWVCCTKWRIESRPSIPIRRCRMKERRLSYYRECNHFHRQQFLSWMV
jgi:hypothetical protein